MGKIIRSPLILVGEHPVHKLIYIPIITCIFEGDVDVPIFPVKRL